DQKQRAAITAGDPPSVVAGETFMPTYANSGILEPLPQDIVDAVNPSFLIKDKNGVPMAVAHKASIFMLFYNKKLLADAGLDPEAEIKTWEDWQNAARTVTEKGNGEVWGGGIPTFPHFGGSLRATPFFRQKGTDFGRGRQLDGP
ncbi:MAG TPA: extracellular solute-binding protein, partial [Polymorphobacter sp.]|nr:extracellular solute-binding protein [Polymorphobacter sp.]